MARLGRPPTHEYSEELADEICAEIASNSKSVKKLCDQNPHWPTQKIIWEWIRKYPDFRNKYTRAKQEQVETYVDEILDISDNCNHDTVINSNGEVVANYEYMARSRLRIDTRKWLASKLVPKLYGTGISPEQEQSLVEKILDKIK